MSRHKRRHHRRTTRSSCPARRPLQFETLEDRRLLATFTVTSNADAGPGSLRDAISIANTTAGADTIDFDTSVFSGGEASLIRLTTGELEITDTLTIDGSTAVEVTISGDANGDDITDASNITDVAASFGSAAGDPDDLLDDNSRVLNFSSEMGDLTLEGLSITGGRTTGGAGFEDSTFSGGGIRSSSSGILSLNSSRVSGNSTAGIGARGGGIRTSSGGVTLTSSTVSGNSTAGRYARGGGIRTWSGAVTLTLSTVSGNSTAEYFSYGGGIYTYSGAVTLTSSNVSGNSTTGDEAKGGGIHTSTGAVTLTNSEVSGNSTAGTNADGGGIWSGRSGVTLSSSTVSGNSVAGWGATGGGIYSRDSPVTLRNSTVSGNSTTGIAQAPGGGIYTFGAAVTLTSSTVSGNSTVGGASSGGGGIYTAFGPVTLTSSTVSGNSVVGSDSDGGGIYSFAGSVTLRSSTVSGNSSGRVAGGVFVHNSRYSSSISIENSIVAGNTDNGTAPDLQTDPDGSVVTINHSLVGVSDNFTIDSGENNHTGTAAIPLDPQLGPLADNGGPTQTHALLPGSPAIDSGDPMFDVNGPDGIVGSDDDNLFDQRGIGFDRVLGGRVDMGAFEVADSASAFPKVVSATIDEGGVLARPDLWIALTVVFDQDVSITAEALSLSNDTLGGTAVDLSQASFVYTANNFTATWTFDPTDPLPAAFYTYTLNASSITAGGLQLDGDGDGTGGDDVVAEHYVALPGDANLDGDVDVSDIRFVGGSIQNVGDASILLANLGNNSGQVWANGDFNGDGDVDVSQIQITPVFANVGDASILLANLGSSVVPPAAAVFAAAPSVPASSLALNSQSSFVPVVVSATRSLATTESEQSPVSESSGWLTLAGNQELDTVFAESDSNLGDDDGPASDVTNAGDLLAAELGEVEFSIV